MLVSFRLANFKSFRDEVTLLLSAVPSDKTLPDAVIGTRSASEHGTRELDPNDGEGILACVALYGANASGKTNFLIALDRFRAAINFSQAHWKPDYRTGLYSNATCKDNTSLLEAVITLSGVRYRYGFRGTSKDFLEEWLYSYPVGRERLLFHRKTDVHADGYSIEAEFGRHLTGVKRDFDSSRRRVRNNSLLLSALAQDNQKEALEIYEYISAWNSVIGQIDEDVESNFTSRFAESMPDFRKLLLGLLQTSDDSILDIDIHEVEVDNTSIADPDKYQLPFQYSTTMISSIGGEAYGLPLSVQSRGVKKVYSTAASVAMSLLNGSMLIVDELDSSMHPHMVAKMVSLFQNRSTNPNNSQLIFTTHDTHLMNLQHLRRDQVWFVEKGDGFSSLFPLSDFSPRKDENLEAGYLRGKFGAIPENGVSLRLLGIDEAITGSVSLEKFKGILG